METEAGDRLAGNCHDRKQPATSCHYPFAIMASRLRHHAIIMVLMSAAVGMDVKLASIVLAAVIVNADVTFGEAMRDGGIVRKRKGDCRRKDAKHVEYGQNDRRFDTKSLGQDR